jgi:predicted outer membrane repeat protein
MKKMKRSRVLAEALEDRRLLSAVTIYVDQSAAGSGNGQSWLNAFTSLQAGLRSALTQEINAPNSPVTIDVAAGTYSPGSSATNTFQLITDVSLYGGFAPGGSAIANPAANPTILFGGGVNYHVVTGNGVNATTTILEGFTITGGNAHGKSANTFQDDGGGVLDFSGSPTIIGCTFAGDSAVDGGAIYNADNSDPTLINCIFSGDTATSGGAIYSSSATQTLTNCAFNDDSATNGGAVYNSGSAAQSLSGCVFSNDSASSNGGAIDNVADSSQTLTGCTFTDNSSANGGGVDNNSSEQTLNNCSFAGNSAGVGGGAIGNNASTQTLTDCSFTGNFAGFDGGAIDNVNSSQMLTNCGLTANACSSNGGGIFSQSASLTLVNCLISGNTAASNGGGLFNLVTSPALTNCAFAANSADDGGGISDSSSSPTLINCTFASNAANDLGGAMYDQGGSSYGTAASVPILTNCILWGDSAFNGGDEISDANDTASGAAVTSSDVDGGFSGTGNINANPLFVANPLPSVDYYGNLELQTASACIGSGNVSALPVGDTTDLAGNPRTVSGSVGMGAYEFQPGAPATPTLVFAIQPGNTTIGAMFSPAIVVDVEDSSGKTITSDNSSVTLTLTISNGAVLSGSLTAQAINGVATFSGLSVNTVGTYSLTATDGALTADVSGTFVVDPITPASLVIARQPADTAAGLTIPIVVDIADQNGNVDASDESNVTVSISTGPSMSLTGTATVAAVNGVATFSDLSLATAGTYSLQVTDAADNLNIVSRYVVISPSSSAIATKLVFHEQPDSTEAGGSLGVVTVYVEDAEGNVVTTNTSTVTLAIGSGARESQLAGSLNSAAVNGIATFSGLSINEAGSFTLKATDRALKSALSGNFTLTPVLGWRQQPMQVQAGAKFTTPIVVDFVGLSGSTVTDATGSVQLSIVSGPAGGAISGTSKAMAKSGVATFSNLSFNVAGTYTLAASSGPLSPVDSMTFVVAPGPAYKLVFAEQPASSTRETEQGAVTVDVEDKFGNILTNDVSTSVDIKILGGSSVPLSMEDFDGVATFDDIAITKIGGYQLEALSTGLKNGESSKFTVKS